MKQILLSTLLSFLSFSISWGQKNNVELTINVPFDTVAIDEIFQITYTLKNTKAIEWITPELEQFELISGPMTSQSVSIINGDMTQSTSYTYHVKATTLGFNYIPSFHLETEEGLLSTDEIPLYVVEQINRPGIQPYEDMNGFWSDPFDDPFSRAPFNRKQFDGMNYMNEFFRDFDQLFNKDFFQIPHDPGANPKKKLKKKEKVYRI